MMILSEFYSSMIRMSIILCVCACILQSKVDTIMALRFMFISRITVWTGRISLSCATEQQYQRRRVLEAIHIRSRALYTINLEFGLNIGSSSLICTTKKVNVHNGSQFSLSWLRFKVHDFWIISLTTAQIYSWKIENAIIAEVLRWWKQRKEFIFLVQPPYNHSLWTPLKPLNPHRLQQLYFKL